MLSPSYSTNHDYAVCEPITRIRVISRMLFLLSVIMLYIFILIILPIEIFEFQVVNQVLSATLPNIDARQKRRRDNSSDGRGRRAGHDDGKYIEKVGFPFSLFFFSLDPFELSHTLLPFDLYAFRFQ